MDRCATDPIQFSAQVSSGNKDILALLDASGPPDTSVVFQFEVYQYDSGADRYFPAFHSGGVDLLGRIESIGGSLNMHISTGQSLLVPVPPNYTFDLGVMPIDLTQEIYYSISVDQTIVRSWGVGAGPGPGPSPGPGPNPGPDPGVVSLPVISCLLAIGAMALIAQIKRPGTGIGGHR